MTKKLNWDVFAEIISHLSPNEVLSMSLACKCLRTLSIPVLLREVVLTLRSARQLNQLIDFLLVAVDRRPQMMRRLELRADRSPYARPRRRYLGKPKEHLNEVGFVIALLQARNLEILVLEWAEDLFTVYKHSGAIFLGLQRLKTVQLVDFGESAMHVLHSSRSAPRGLLLSWPRNFTGYRIQESSAFRHLVEWVIHSVRTASLLSNCLVLPSVRYLTWTGSDNVSLASLVTSFPNVQTVELRENVYSSFLFWQHLDRFTGHLIDVYSIFAAVQDSISVRYLCLTEDVPADHDLWAELLSVLQSCKPYALWLPIDPRDNLTVPPEVLQALDCVRSLKVTITDQDTVRAHRWFIKLGDNFRELRLTAFCLCLKRSRTPQPQDFDADTASYLAGSVPTASLVGFEADSDESSLHMWWRVMDEEVGAGRRLEQLPLDLSDRVSATVFSANRNSDLKANVQAIL
ncbi:hypothetical protein EIP91_000194 [Steccherinum ochraceum]|uniref:F-box domain-containing protein n=1 Tax=Steccherinum ochraceum TaxID=92696 RepID=A0A4R0RQD3_9APHY|nr:hypothetical protein EIP91_000194 [Steccherinum ochraceum]